MEFYGADSGIHANNCNIFSIVGILSSFNAGQKISGLCKFYGWTSVYLYYFGYVAANFDGMEGLTGRDVNG